jgi:hypothetical protein
VSEREAGTGWADRRSEGVNSAGRPPFCTRPRPGSSHESWPTYRGEVVKRRLLIVMVTGTMLSGQER